VKDLRSLHPDIKKKIKSALKMISEDPCVGKALKDELEGLKSYRVKRFRIIYQIEKDKEINIVAVGPRANIYEETYVLLKIKQKKDKDVWWRTIFQLELIKENAVSPINIIV
jgi:mRNA interferase RelE/StbE